MPGWPAVSAAGLAIGVLAGLFGVGGSSVATPVLGLLGVPGLVAVASPVVATVPTAAAGMVAYVRRGQVEWPVARWALYGGVPTTVLGAALSRRVGGRGLLVASGVTLGLVGLRILMPLPEKHLAGRARRRPGVVVPAAAAIGVVTGMLANGGGFLLVPLFVLVLGLTMPESAGTSLVVIAVLSVPTLVAHWALGHVDWAVALPFAAGSIPGAVAGSRLTPHIPADALRRGFGILLVAFALFFVVPPARHLGGLRCSFSSSSWKAWATPATWSGRRRRARPWSSTPSAGSTATSRRPGPTACASATASTATGTTTTCRGWPSWPPASR